MFISDDKRRESLYCANLSGNMQITHTHPLLYSGDDGNNDDLKPSLAGQKSRNLPLSERERPNAPHANHWHRIQALHPAGVVQCHHNGLPVEVPMLPEVPDGKPVHYGGILCHYPRHARPQVGHLRGVRCRGIQGRDPQNLVGSLSWRSRRHCALNCDHPSLLSRRFLVEVGILVYVRECHQVLL